MNLANYNAKSTTYDIIKLGEYDKQQEEAGDGPAAAGQYQQVPLPHPPHEDQEQCEVVRADVIDALLSNTLEDREPQLYSDTVSLITSQLEHSNTLMVSAACLSLAELACCAVLPLSGEAGGDDIDDDDDVIMIMVMLLMMMIMVMILMMMMMMTMMMTKTMVMLMNDDVDESFSIPA